MEFIKSYYNLLTSFLILVATIFNLTKSDQKASVPISIAVSIKVEKVSTFPTAQVLYVTLSPHLLETKISNNNNLQMHLE